jgi:hypothetical protein
MAPRPEHIPGEAAPAAGTYEQRNIFGSLIGSRVSLAHGAIDAVSPGGAHVDARRGGSGRVLKGAPLARDRDGADLRCADDARRREMAFSVHAVDEADAMAKLAERNGRL